MTDKPIYLVQVPNTFSPQKIAEIWETIEKKVKDKTVIVSEYEGTEIKHTVLGDSFNKELYEAKMFKDAVFRMIRDTDVATSCILVGGNVKLSDTYGFDVDSPENAIMDIIVRYYKQIIVIEELEHKIKMLSL